VHALKSVGNCCPEADAKRYFALSKSKQESHRPHSEMGRDAAKQKEPKMSHFLC